MRELEQSGMVLFCRLEGDKEWLMIDSVTAGKVCVDIVIQGEIGKPTACMTKKAWILKALDGLGSSISTGWRIQREGRNESQTTWVSGLLYWRF